MIPSDPIYFQKQSVEWLRENSPKYVLEDLAAISKHNSLIEEANRRNADK